MSEQRPRSEFSDVDRADAPQNYVECLDFQRNIDFVLMYKQRVRALLDIEWGQQILEVGVGTGEDAQEVAKLVGLSGQVVGLDFSQTMVDVAQQRSRGMNLPVRFVQGDVHQLSFADNTFDRCYADRTFQHLPDALFKEFGLTDVKVEPLTRIATDYETIRPVAHYIEGMRAAQQYGAVTAEEAERWITYVEDAIRNNRFFHAVTYFITTGYKSR